MVTGSLQYPDTYKDLLVHPTWKTILKWLNENLVDEDGIQNIQGEDIYASNQTITTIPREEGVFEAHREYIDLHYCIAGDERIEWALTHTLQTKEDFNTAKDYGLYDSPTSSSSILLVPHMFAIFFPTDAHMPKLRHTTKQTKKTVIKIRKTLLTAL